MNFFKTGLSKFTKKTMGIYKTTKNKLNETRETLTKTVKKTVRDQKTLYFQIHPTKISDFTTEIIDNVYWMPFPEKGVIEKYSRILNEAFEENYKIWNVSEYCYDTKFFNDQVMEYINTGYPNPSLVELFLICKEMINWMNSDPKNLVIVHCQKSRSRSALVLSCLLYELGIHAHPCAALTEIGDKLSFDEECFLKTCNHVYANYYALMSSDMKLNSKKVRIKRIILSEAPEINLKPEHRNKDQVLAVQKMLKPYVQFFSKRSIIYNSVDKEKGFPLIEDGQPVIFKPEKEIDGDVLIRLRHFLSREVRYPVMRIMLNTCMLVNENTRFHASDLDLGDSITVSENFYVDVIIETLEDVSDSWEIVTKVREDQKHRKKQKKPNLKLSVRSGSSQSDDDLFEINDSPLINSKNSNFENTVSPINIKTPQNSDGKFNKKMTPVKLQSSGSIKSKSESKEEVIKKKEISKKKKSPKKKQIEVENEEEDESHDEEKFAIDEKDPENEIKKLEEQVKINNLEEPGSEESDDDDDSSEETGDIDMDEYLKKLENEAK